MSYGFDSEAVRDDLQVEFLSMFDQLEGLAAEMWRVLGWIIRDHPEVFVTDDGSPSDIGIVAVEISKAQAAYLDMCSLASHTASELRENRKQGRPDAQ